MTQRIEPFNFLNMTQRIEPFNFLNMTQRWTVKFLEYDDKNWTLFLNMTWRIEPFFKIWLEELKICQWNFFNMTQKLKIFPTWFEELNPLFLIWFTDMIFFGEKWVKYLNPFWTWLKELNFFHLIQIIEPYFKIGSQNWIFKNYFKYWVFWKTLKELKELNPSWISLIGLNFFCWKYDSKNWTFFFTWLKYLLFFLKIFDSKKWTLFSGLKVFSPIKNNSQNWTFCESDPQNWFFFVNTIHRIDPFFNTTHRIEHFLNTTHRIEPFFFFWIRLTEIKTFLECDAKNWTV